jgi:uncharacterized caspase-like protein
MQLRLKAFGLAALLAASIGASAPNAQQPGHSSDPSAAEGMRHERRVALVIGNAAYGAGIGSLANPSKDAAAVAQALRAADFEVTLKLNVRRDEMLRAMADFGRSLRDGGVGLFYYAGHAVQMGGSNYLIPLGANVDNEDYVPIETVDLNDVLARMGGADNRLNIVILDACRNNPFRTQFRGVTRGLAPTLAPTGTYIAYAAAPGQVAFDGTARNSPYTSALVDELAQPGLRLEDVFKRVGARVVSETKGSQTPWTSSSITGDFYFRLPKSEERETLATPQSPAAPVDISVWSAIANSNNAGDFEVFVKNFPNSALVPFALQRLARLQSPEAAALMREVQPERSPPSTTARDEPKVAANAAHQGEPTVIPTPGALEATPQTVERDLPSSPSRQDQSGVVPTKQPASGGPIALFETRGAEESLTRRSADPQPEERRETRETEQQTQKQPAEAPANTVHARLEDQPGKEASPEQTHWFDLAKVQNRSECEAFLDGVYGDGLRNNASRFETCSKEAGGGAIVLYQQPACKDPTWSQIKGPERCRPLVEYACEVFRRKSDFLAKCDQQLAKRW